MKTIALTVMLSVASAGLGQTPAKEPDTLQSLLSEVHQLRQDIEAMTVTSQRVQIALYALQMQDAAVARATQRLDNMKNMCQGEDVNRQHMASEVKRFESGLASGTQRVSDTKTLELRLADMKSALETQTAAVQTCQAAEADAASQLRNDQASLVEPQDRIDRLDKSLEKLSAGGK
jgi:chromosome segregation ATPase